MKREFSAGGIVFNDKDHIERKQTSQEAALRELNARVSSRFLLECE